MCRSPRTFWRHAGPVGAGGRDNLELLNRDIQERIAIASSCSPQTPTSTVASLDQEERTVPCSWSYHYDRQDASPDSPPESSIPFAPPQPQDTLSPLITTALPADNNLVRRLDLDATSVLPSRPHSLHIYTKTALPGLPDALTLPARVPRHEAWRQQEAHRPKEDRRRRASAKRGPQNGAEARGRADKDQSCHRTYRDSGEPSTDKSLQSEGNVQD